MSARLRGPGAVGLAIRQRSWGPRTTNNTAEAHGCNGRIGSSSSSQFKLGAVHTQKDLDGFGQDGMCREGEQGESKKDAVENPADCSRLGNFGGSFRFCDSTEYDTQEMTEGYRRITTLLGAWSPLTMHPRYPRATGMLFYAAMATVRFLRLRLEKISLDSRHVGPKRLLVSSISA